MLQRGDHHFLIVISHRHKTEQESQRKNNLVFCFQSYSDTAKFAKWHRMMLEKGIYLAPSQYEAGFTSLQHTEEDIDRTIAAAKEVFAQL